MRKHAASHRSDCRRGLFTPLIPLHALVLRLAEDVALPGGATIARAWRAVMHDYDPSSIVLGVYLRHIAAPIVNEPLGRNTKPFVVCGANMPKRPSVICRLSKSVKI